MSPSVFQPLKWPAAFRYLLAVAIFCVALALRFALLPVEAQRAFLIFAPAAVITFLLCGRGPGLLAVVLSAIAGYHIFEAPHWTFAYNGPGVLSTSVFVASSLLIGWVVGRSQNTAQRLNSTLSDLHASESFMHRTGHVAGVGGWEVDLATQKVTWSVETRSIHEVEPDFVPTIESAIAFYSPEVQSVVAEAVRIAMERGDGWDLELPLVTAKGRPIWVRAVGEVELEGHRPVRLVGAFQDITERKLLQRRLADSERFVRQVTDSLPVSIAYTDRESRFQFINRANCERFERDREEIIGRSRAALKPDQASAALKQHVDAALAGQAQHYEFEETVDGSMRRFDVQLIPDLAESGEVNGFFSIGIDITERAANERALRKLTTILRSVTESIPATLAVVSSDGKYLLTNNAFERWVGMPSEQMIGRSVQEVLGEAEYKRRLPWVQRALAGESVSFELDYPAPHKTAHLAITYVPLRLDDGEGYGFVVMTQDVTPQKQEEDRLLKLAQRDPLTRLLNRAGFEERMEDIAASSAGGGLALLYIDLDHFKPVNDQHGHPTGDRVLHMFAQRLQGLVRPTDAVARLGGDEFAVALSGLRDSVDAQAVADKVLAVAKAPFHVGDLHINIGASIGVAFSAGPSVGWRQLIERADTCLLSAKAAGRGRQAGAAD